MAARAPRTAPQPRIEVLASLHVLRWTQPQWWPLWRRCPDATPFQSPAWLLCWARHYAPDRSGAVAVTAGDELLALLPYFTWRETLWLAGTGPSDYGDALVAPGAAGSADGMLDELAALARRNRCRCIDLRQLRGGSVLLGAATPAGWRSRTLAGETCTSLALGGADGLAAASGRWRRNIAQAWRRLGRAGTCAVERVTAAAATTGADTLLALHQRRWNARGEPGLFADGLLRAFVRDVVPALAQAGLLRLYRLDVDGAPVAATFMMRAHHADYFYGTGFDPAWSRFSPGLLSLAAALGGAAAEGDRCARLLRGRESYKYHLGAGDESTWRRVLRRAER